MQVPSEGTAFTQKSKNNDKNNKGEGKSSNKKEAGDGKKGDESKKDWFADKTCYLHGKTGHSVTKCPKRSTIEDGDLSVKSSSSKGSAKKSIAEFKKKMKKNLLNWRPKSKKMKTCPMMRNILIFNSQQCLNSLNELV